MMFGGTPPWGTFTGLPQHVRVDITDTGESLWVQLGRFSGTDPETATYHDERRHLAWCPTPAPSADAVVSGPAAALDAWLWRRGDDGADRGQRRPGDLRALPAGGRPADRLRTVKPA